MLSLMNPAGGVPDSTHKQVEFERVVVPADGEDVDDSPMLERESNEEEVSPIPDRCGTRNPPTNLHLYESPHLQV